MNGKPVLRRVNRRSWLALGSGLVALGGAVLVAAGVLGSSDGQIVVGAGLLATAGGSLATLATSGAGASDRHRN